MKATKKRKKATEMTDPNIDTKKVDILLHYDSVFRDDWRFLHRLRLLVITLYIGLTTSILGWIITRAEPPIELTLKIKLLIIILILTATGVLTLAWFASSLNTLKRLIVRVEEALHLLEDDYFIKKRSLIPREQHQWGARTLWEWGKAIWACTLVGLLYSIFILML